MNDEKSLQVAKNKILNNCELVNNLFEICFLCINDIKKEIEKFNPLVNLFNVANFNNILKLVFYNYLAFIHNIDKNIHIQITNSYNVKYCKTKVIRTILENLSTVLYESKKIKNSAIFFSQYNLNNTEILIHLELFLSNKIICMQNFQLLSINMKVFEINKLSFILNCFCNKTIISTMQLILYFLEKLKSIDDKLIKFTYIVCLLKILNDNTKLRIKSKILKLIIYLFLHLEKNYINMNNEKSLTLLYNIIRINKRENITNIACKEMCFFDNLCCYDIRKLVILRYIYFNFSPKNVTTANIQILVLNLHYFEIIWLMIKCFTISTYNIFHVEF